MTDEMIPPDTVSFETVPPHAPVSIPIFPLPDVILLPDGDLPLNIFEPRYIAMVRHALAGDRLIGMIQPFPRTTIEIEQEQQVSPFYRIGCAGRISSFDELKDGRFLINLQGVSRFELLSHDMTADGYYQAQVDFKQFIGDLHDPDPLPECMTRQCLMDKFQEYLQRQGLHVDWDMADAIPDHRFYTLLAMICPFTSAEKQALLEAKNFEERCRMMKCMMEIACAEEHHPPSPEFPC